MKRHRWFLPETPDVVGLLRDQVAVTTDGLDALVAWARGDEHAAAAIRDAELRGDAAKRTLLSEVRAAFVTPVEPEDLFLLSQGVDWILNYARDLVDEAAAIATLPDETIASMAALLARAMRQLDQAIALLHDDHDAATSSADAAIQTERHIEQVYYDGMAALLRVSDRAERIGRRELYRRCVRIGEVVIDVAERVVYAVFKQS